MTDRAINEIARDIRKDWHPVNFGAVPYLDAMLQLEKITDPYYAESGESIVLYFLSNANSWRGPVARAIKAELNVMLKKAKR
jgi:hypothetical protein